MPARKAAMLLIVTDNGLLMHLRDDKPGIPNPGCWAGFGGAVEEGETVGQALRREVLEETGLEIESATFLTTEVDHEGDGREVSLFYVAGDYRPEDIDLREGAGVAVHPVEDLPGLKMSPFVRRAIRSHLLPVLAQPPLPGNDRDVVDAGLPAIPASAGALIFDQAGRLLILKPTYKTGWTIPGGVMEADGETPWEACQREVREECGLEVRHGRLACVDFRPPRPERPGGIRFLFDCGQADDAELAAITVQPEEVAEYRLVPLDAALELLRPPIRRRVRAATRHRRCVYLENGRPVAGVG